MIFSPYRLVSTFLLLAPLTIPFSISLAEETIDEDVFKDAEESDWDVDSFGTEEDFSEETPKEAAKPAPKKAPEPAPEEDDLEPDLESESPTPEPTLTADLPVNIQNLEFKVFASTARVLVTANGPMEFEQEQDEAKKQVVVIIKNVGMKSQLRRRLDTTEFKSPVRMISAVPITEPYPAVRIVVQLRKNVVPSVSPEGNVLNIDFVADDYAQSTKPTTGKNQGNKETKFLDTEEELKIGGTFQDLVTGPEKFYGKKIDSLSVSDEELTDVLRFIASVSGYNIIASEDVKGKVTIALKEVPWDQALYLILKSKGMGYVKSGNVLRVGKIESFQKEKEDASKALEANTRAEPLRTLLIPVSHADTNELMTQIKDFLSDRGKISMNTRTNTLVIKDVEVNLNRIQKLVTTLDVQTPQVLIESRLIEANKSFLRDVGFDKWNISAATEGLAGGGRPVFGPSHAGMGNSFNVGGAVDYTLSKMTLPITIRPIDTLALSAQLALAEQDKMIKTITSPRVVTLDNQPATLDTKITITVPFFTSAGGTAGGATTVAYKEIPSQTKFDVTPHITAEGSILLKLDVQREYTGQSTIKGNSIPDVFTRKAKTTLLVENGETAVIGGFYNNEKAFAEGGVPWLRHLPLLGFFFRSRSTSESNTELIFFVTPRIINAEKSMVTSK